MNNQDLEPEAEKLLNSGLEINHSPALYSIAISLKRIADMMERDLEEDFDIPDPEKN